MRAFYLEKRGNLLGDKPVSNAVVILIGCYINGMSTGSSRPLSYTGSNIGATKCMRTNICLAFYVSAPY